MKLAFAFELMDEDEDGVLSKRGLWRYFRAFLCTLLTISGASLDMLSDELITVCDDCAVWTSSQLLNSLQTKESESVRGCSFEDLADWYTQGGYMVATWLELLDLSKWLPLRPLAEPQMSRASQSASRAREASRPDAQSYQSRQPQQQQPSPYAEDDEDDEDDSKLPENPFAEEDGAEIFRSELAKGHSLSLYESDSNFVLEVSQLTGFYNMSPPALIGRLLQYSRENGTLTIANYNSFVSNSVPSELVRTVFLLFYEQESFSLSYANINVYIFCIA